MPGMRRLKELEAENRRLNSIAADRAVDIQFLKEINAEKWLAHRAPSVLR